MIKRESKLFVSEFIPKVSRTFALAIKFLPIELRHTVFTAYLLCRVVDTIEDSPHIATADKRERLLHLNKLLISGAKGTLINPNDIVPLYQGINPEQGHDHRLLGKSLELFDVLSELPDTKRRIIYHWAGEMAGGMAGFVDMTIQGKGKIAALKNTLEWDRYCYCVAGTVGQMLTGLIIAQYDLEKNIADEMTRLSNSFGLGLQKVNTIKDVPGDMARGVVYLPNDIMAKHGLMPEKLRDTNHEKLLTTFIRELVDIAETHLDDAMEYTILLPERLKGVRMFLTVPVLLAQATLKLIVKYPVQTMVGPAVKISHQDVIHLTAMAKLYSPSNEALMKYYLKQKNLANLKQ
jgi:farnesyl-diphosphate farnesyltransferase